MRLGLVLEITTSFQHFKHGIEIRILSLGQDNSQSRVRECMINYGVDSIQDSTENPADPEMNLTAKMPSIVSSSTSSNPVKTWYGYQDPGKSVAGDDRSGKLERPSPPDHSKEDHGQC